MSGRARGRGRATAPPPGAGLGPTGRGRGLVSRAPEPASVTPETPAAAPRIGRGLAASTAQSSGIPAGAVWGRGKIFAAPPSQNPASSLSDAPSDAPSPAPAPASGAPAAAATAGPSVPPPAPVVSLNIDLDAMKLALPDFPLYKRPKKGTKGREIRLESNLFKIELKDAVWYKYDVEISTQTESKVELATAGAPNRDRIQSRRLNRMVIDTLFRKHAATLDGQYPAYDGRKTLICAKKFFDEHIFTVDVKFENGRSKQYVVKLKLTLEIDVSQVNMFYNNVTCPLNPEVLQAANIVIDSSLGSSYTAVNRAYYAVDATLRGFPLTGGKELRSGIYTSMVYAEWKPLLVVDKSNTAFYMKGDLLDYIKEFFNDHRGNIPHAGLRRDQVQTLSRDLRGVHVRLKHAPNGRSVKINSVTENSANHIEFRLADGTMTTVAAYFRDRYGEGYGPLKYPNLPCVTVVRGGGSKTDYYPLEVCEIKENQAFRKKLNPKQTSEMIRKCQGKPDQRILDAIQNVRTILRMSNPVLKQHGVSISEKPVETVGRMIDSPMIQVKGQKIPVQEGRWIQREFHEGARLGQWCVVDCDGVGPHRTEVARKIVRVAHNMKLQNVGNPIGFIDGTNKPVEWTLKEVKKLHDVRKGPMMAVVILPNPQSNPMYSLIKRLSETTKEFEGIITQCVLAENVRSEKKFNDNFVNNLLKKMNVKLGGINNAIANMPKKFKEESFIIIGADVSHPGVGDCMTPSIAAVVGSLDYIPSKYWTEIRVQTNENNNRIEYIKDLKEVTMILLREHYGATRKKPAHIYYIRDGVSDGQFEEVRRREIGALRDACKSLGDGGYRPKMTVLIAQKRHHTRFNVLDKRDGTRSGNVPPGTYIDKDVVHPQNFDLYMYTHQGLLGTSRPTHYHLIHSDDDTFTTDDITEIIYHLCHCYARTTSTVSIPAPIYYAHLAAYRAKEHVKGDLSLMGSDSRSMSSGGDGVITNLSEYQKTCTVDVRLRSWLYYA